VQRQPEKKQQQQLRAKSSSRTAAAAAVAVTAAVAAFGGGAAAFVASDAAGRGVLLLPLRWAGRHLHEQCQQQQQHDLLVLLLMLFGAGRGGEPTNQKIVDPTWGPETPLYGVRLALVLLGVILQRWLFQRRHVYSPLPSPNSPVPFPCGAV
jgi:hypothetical protein